MIIFYTLLYKKRGKNEERIVKMITGKQLNSLEKLNPVSGEYMDFSDELVVDIHGLTACARNYLNAYTTIELVAEKFPRWSLLKR